MILRIKEMTYKWQIQRSNIEVIGYLETLRRYCIEVLRERCFILQPYKVILNFTVKMNNKISTNWLMQTCI